MNDNTTNLLFTSLATSGMCAYLLQALQKWSKTPWITAHTTGINVGVRMALSFAATLGISVAWNSGADNSHILMVAIPSGTLLAKGALHWVGQYFFQHAAGKVLSIPEDPPKPLIVLEQPPKP